MEKIKPLKETEYFAKYGKKHECLIWGHVAPSFEISMKNGEYVAQVGTGLLHEVGCCPSLTDKKTGKELKGKSASLRACVISMVSEQLHSQLEAANLLLKKLQEDGHVNPKAKPISNKEFVNEFLFTKTSKRYKRFKEIQKQCPKGTLIAV